MFGGSYKSKPFTSGMRAISFSTAPMIIAGTNPQPHFRTTNCKSIQQFKTVPQLITQFLAKLFTSIVKSTVS
jgi:hypothetical protein